MVSIYGKRIRPDRLLGREYLSGHPITPVTSWTADQAIAFLEKGGEMQDLEIKGNQTVKEGAL
jgi:hypothetical protein